MAGEKKTGQPGGAEGGVRGPLTLSVDTATDTRSVAVQRGTETLSLYSSALRAGGAANILADIDRCLSGASVRLSDIELFAVAAGPGSFTGLRAGIATLKAFASTLAKPLVGVPTLHAVAHAARPAGLLAALIPAGRGEVFGQFLRVTREGLIDEIEGPYHLPPSRLVGRAVEFGAGVKWAGDGVLKFHGLITEVAASAGIKILDGGEGEGGEPKAGEWLLAARADVLATHIGLLARSKFEGGASSAADEVRALYVRPSDAEMNEQCRGQV